MKSPRSSFLRTVILAIVCLAGAATISTSGEALAQTQYTFHTIDLADSAASTAYHVNNNGQIAGRVDGSDGVGRGFIYSLDGSLDLFDGPDGQSPFSETWAINLDGQSAVYISNEDFTQFDAFRRDADGSLTPVNYQAAPGPSNFAIDIVDGGDVLVQGDGITFWHGADGSQQTLNVQGYSTNAGWGANDSGMVVGVAWPGFFDTPNGLIYDSTDDSFEIWNYPDAFETSLHDINNNGVIVGTTKMQLDQGDRSFVRHEDGSLQFIDFPNAESTRLWGINDSGVLSGRYLDGEMVSHAFFAVPVPEPSSVSLAMVLGMLFAMFARRSPRKP